MVHVDFEGPPHLDNEEGRVEVPHIDVQDSCMYLDILQQSLDPLDPSHDHNYGISCYTQPLQFLQ